jgi:hypothetical protein
VSTGILIVLLAGVLVSQALQAGATHQPADKVVASGRTLQVFAPGSEVELLEATLKTAKPTDLMLHVSAECSILTKLDTVGGDTQSPETDTARGDVRVWIEVTTEGVPGVRIVPIGSTSEPPQEGSTPNSGTKAADGATFCNRTYERRVVDNEDDDDGIDGERDYIETKTANAFNWLLLNAGSGVHTVTVKADLTATGNQGAATATCSPNTTTAETCAAAYVGNRTLIVEPAKLANDAVIN